LKVDRLHVSLGLLNYNLGGCVSQGKLKRYAVFRLSKSALLLLPLKHFLPVQLVLLQPVSLSRAFRIYRELRKKYLILQELPRLGRSSFLRAISYIEIADDGRGRAPLGWAGGRPSRRALLRLAWLRFRIDIKARRELFFNDGRIIGARGGVQIAEYRRRSGHRRMELRIWRATGQNRRRFYAVLELLRTVFLGGKFHRWPWSSELSSTSSFIIDEITPRARLPPCF
jgi:hypothetical protein